LSAESFRIRPADPAQSRTLAPMFFRRSPPPREVGFVVATAPDANRPVGAGAFWFAENRQYPGRARALLHVARSHRRRGLGRALLDQIVTTARDGGATELISPPLHKSGTAFQFLRASGFEVVEQVVTFGVHLERLVSQECYDRLIARGKIPPTAKIIPLANAPVEEVSKIVLDTRAFVSAQMEQRFRRNEHGFSQTLSPIVMVDGRVVGATLITYQNDVAMIDAAAVAPEWRNTWISVVMKNTIGTWLRDRGVREMRFSANPVLHRDTAKYAKRSGARVVKTIVTMQRNLATSVPAEDPFAESANEKGVVTATPRQ
jgi:GNAT superfamily N-acetyltransferase